LLDQLVKKQSETEVASRLQGTGASNVMMVDRALMPGGPFRPSLRRNLMLGLIVGIGLGLAAIFLLEYLDRTLKTAEDVDRVLKIPVLAIVPDLASHGSSRRDAYYGYYYGKPSKKKQAKLLANLKEATRRSEVKIELVPHTRPRLAVSEAYRSLRTSLLLSSADGLHSVVVTSAIPGEGKTSTAVNLAVVLAQLGRDVLLVDGDLRKPRLHEVFGVSNRSGLVNYLTGNPPETLFGRTSVPNLCLTPAGPIPPNPAELLASKRMREFLALVKEHFAFVVIDSPPALPVTDSAVLGSMVDGVVLCVGAGVVLRDDARSCRERLRLADAKVLGASLNYYRERHARYSGAYRHYEAYVASSANGSA
jgi:capsular exopolysaccharide synthesis family protein